MHRPTAVTLLGVFDIVSGFAGLAMGGLTIVSGLNASDGRRQLLVYGAILCAGGILYLVAGRGLLKLEPYGRTAQMIINVIGLGSGASASTSPACWRPTTATPSGST
jgi:hypothetical protein